MILRIDRLQTELPPPSDPDPAGAAAVQELLGGKFGEMSTFMNYTYQSFNFRARQKARPFYDLVASIAAEEFGHIQLVSATINTMLTGTAQSDPGRGALADVKGTRNTQHYLAPGGAGALVQDSMGRPWTGENVFSRGRDRGPHTQLLPRDRCPQRQAARLRDGRASRRPCADRLPARARRRAPGRLRPRSRATDRRRPEQAVPFAADRDRQDPRVQAASRARRAPQSSTASPPRTSARSSPSSTDRILRPERTSSSPRSHSPRARSRTTFRRSPRSSRPDRSRRRSTRSLCDCARPPVSRAAGRRRRLMNVSAGCSGGARRARQLEPRAMVLP
jgi:hypothetical protein